MLCDEFDIDILMEKLKHLTNKIENRAKAKHEGIESVIEKLEGLIKTTADLLPLKNAENSEENMLKVEQCTGDCRKKIEKIRQKIVTDFIDEMVEAVKEEKTLNKELRNELKGLAKDFAAEIPNAEYYPFSKGLAKLESKLENLDSKFDAYLLRLRNNEKLLHTRSKKGKSSRPKPTKERCSRDQNNKGLEIEHIPLNDTVKVLKAEIYAVKQEIYFTVQAINKKTASFP